MVDPPASPALSAENERSLKSLIRATSLVQERFSLILLHCNYSRLQSQIMQRLHQQQQIQMRSIVLPKTAQTLFTVIKAELGEDTPPALVVSGLDAVERLETLLLATNQVRDEFRKSLRCPLVLWVTSEVLTQLVRLAPDFYSWAASPISFQLPASELEDFLRQQADRCFAEILNPQQPLPVDHLFRCQLEAMMRRQEVEAALRDLQKDHELQPDLIACREFILGKADYAEDKIEQAIAHYTASLNFWQRTNHRERQGATLLYLGLCYLRSAEIGATHRIRALEAARDHLQACLEVFESAGRPDLKAKLIGYQGEVLERLNAWAELQTLLQEAQFLHYTYSVPIEQARDQGLLAAIALRSQQDNLAACRHAEAALRILSSLTNHPPAQVAQYQILLAEAQQNLDQTEAAITSLHQARNSISPNGNPHLYIQILERLRALYFRQKRYEEAFQFKCEQLRIESQYGFRAFIGAGSLQPLPAGSRATHADRIAEEITVSGRQQDVSRLVERVSRDDCKLTILHGQLGVGKSSLIQAGLIPILEQEPIKARDSLVVLLRNYNSWADKLGNELAEQIQAKRRSAIATPPTSHEILEQLRNNENLDFLTILIFDQFEEFFFSCPQLHARGDFFAFLSSCLEIPFLKIILSLREDYLHYLLEWERFDDLRPINDNILSKDHRYELSNFSAKDTRNIIQGLTHRSHLSLQGELVEQLVQDLTGETGEIRPIELQVVGAQLHEEKIKTLEQYKLLGDRPKEMLVQNYLEGVIRDCGAENENAARLVLFLLTGENNTRPSKTRDELETDLKALEKDLLKEAEKLDLVLEIFRQSGLVFLLPEIPADRYQLVHDYLVAFIRKQQPKVEELVKELETKRKQLEEAEQDLAIMKLEKILAEEQENLARESQRRIEAELTLEKNRKFRLFLCSLLLAASSIAIVAFVSQNEVREANRGLNNYLYYERGSVLDLYSLYVEDLTRFNATEAALVEMIHAGDMLSKLYSEEGRLFQVESPEETSKKIVKQLQVTIAKAVKDRKIRPEERTAIVVSVQGMEADELHELLVRLLKIGCTYVQQDELKRRQWQATLCERYQ